MNLFDRRRILMMMGGAEPAPVIPQYPLGEFTKGYYNAAVTPESNNLLVVPHNLGILPKVALVKANFEPLQNVPACVEAVCAFFVYGLTDNYLHICIDKYWFNNNLVRHATRTSNQWASTTELRLNAPYSTARSPWNTNGTYSVWVWG